MRLFQLSPVKQRIVWILFCANDAGAAGHKEGLEQQPGRRVLLADEVCSQGPGGTRAGPEGARFMHQNIRLQGTMINWKMALKNGPWKITRDRQMDGGYRITRKESVK